MSEFVDNFIVFGFVFFIFIIIWKKVTGQTMADLVIEIKEAITAMVTIEDE